MIPDPTSILDRLKRGHAGSGVGPLECKEAIDLIERLTAPMTSDLSELVRELNELDRLITDNRVSNEVLGMRLRNSWRPAEAAAAIELLSAEKDEARREANLMRENWAEADEDKADAETRLKEAMDMLGDMPGKTLAERLTKYVGEYMGMQVRLKEAEKVLKKFAQKSYPTAMDYFAKKEAQHVEG